MSNENWLKKSTILLKNNNITTARLDCIVLLGDVTSKNRAWLLAHPEYEISEDKLKILETQILRRSKHEPLAYIRGRSEFYGREFQINNHTLEPRPETETMIELLKSLPDSFETIIDIGTGSGAIAITSKFLYPNTNVIGTDIDKNCTQTAKLNARQNNVSIEFYTGNLLTPIISNVHNFNKWIILSNLPYVPESHTINKAAMFEPKTAIFGGKDGLDYYKGMFEQIDELTNRPFYVLTESLPFQHDVLEEIAKQSGYSLYKKEDFIQTFVLFRQ